MNQMGYPTHPYGPYHSLAQAGGMGGPMMTSQIAMLGQQPSGTVGVHQNGTMGQQNNLMGAQGVMPQSGAIMASPYMTGMTQSMMGQQQSGMMVQQQGVMMGQQHCGMMVQQQSGMMGQQQSGIMGQQQSGMMGQQPVGALPHHQAYGVQHAQQLQWNITQVCACVSFHSYEFLR